MEVGVVLDEKASEGLGMSMVGAFWDSYRQRDKFV